MGCCCGTNRHLLPRKSARPGRFEEAIENGYLIRPMKKVLEKCTDAETNARLFAVTSSTLRAWNLYMVALSRGNNVFTYMMRDAQVKNFFYGTDSVDDTEKMQTYNLHLKLTHELLDFCLKSIFHGCFLEEVGVLYTLGAIHSERGVTAKQFKNFVYSAIQAVRRAGEVFGEDLGEREIESLAAGLGAIVECILMGLEKHHDKEVFLDMLVDNTGGCMGRRRAKLKCVDKAVKASWHNLERQIVLAHLD